MKNASITPSIEGQRANALIFGYVCLYVVLDWLSYLQGITPWNPQCGLTLAFLLTLGPRQAGWTALAAFLAELIVRGFPPVWPAALIGPLVISGGYALAVALLRRRSVSQEIDSPEQVISFVGVIAPASLIVSFLYVALFPSEPSSRNDSFICYWVGDLNGALTITPLVLAGKHWRRGVFEMLQRRWEVLAQFASGVVALWIRLGQLASSDLIFVYPIFVPVIWVAFRWGVVGAALSALIFQVGLIIAANGYADSTLLVNMQMLAVTMGTTGLLLGSVVSSRTVALRRVATQEAEQRAILTTAPDAVVATNAEGRIVSVNPAALQLFQFTDSDLVGQSLIQRLPKIELNAVSGRASLHAVRRDDSNIPVDVAWARLEPPAADGFILIIRDVTDRLASEALLRERDTVLAKATRFAVVGEFASALTHELNQPITALVSYLRAAQILAAPIKDQDPRLTETLDKAAREAIRTSDVLRRLRDFYRGGTPHIGAVDIQEVTSSVLKTYEDRLRQLNVQLHDDYATSLPTVMADRTQIEMILHNLFTNAMDAVADCPESNRAISVTASHHDSDLLLTIEDSGSGISPEIAGSLFDPFVTTKPSGMGLGLAISRSLLRNHGGDLWTEASVNSGARFVVRMPVIAAATNSI